MEELGLAVGGFLFSTNKDYTDAKEEQETVSYLKENTDLENPKTVLKLYNKLTENRTFHTPVGYTFLKELQDIVINSSLVKPENLDSIYIPPLNYSSSGEQNALLAKQFKEAAEKERNRNKNSLIINIFLSAVIIIMFGIAFYSDKTTYSKFENKVIDKYASWEEELNQREQTIKDLEAKLKVNEE